jgi:hypothetical protein
MPWRAFAAATLALVPALALLFAPRPAAADWLSRLIVAGERAASKAGRHGGSLLDEAAAQLKSLPPGAKGTALAAHVSQEGHWTFLNRAGERMTAASPDEMARVLRTLGGGAGADARPTLILTEDAVFKHQARLRDLPRGAELRVAVGNASYPLLRRTEGGADRHFAEVRPQVLVSLGERRLFDEAVFQLSRRLDKARVRVLALEPGGPHTLARTPKLDPATGRALVDAIDPYKLTEALRALRGQTAVVTGRIERDLLVFKPASGAERSVILKDLTRAAEAADVDLVVLRSPTPRQPGGRNRLWLRVNVKGLDEALERAELADFLAALAGAERQLIVTAAESGHGRTVLTTVGAGAPQHAPGGRVGEVLSELVSEVTGQLATTAVEAHMKDSSRQKELDARILPYLPSDLQFAYLGALVLGLVGLPFARAWWLRLWPAERREEYANAAGYHAARLVKLVAFLLVFLPLVALPAALMSLASQAWAILTLPFRALGWLARRLGLAARSA